MARANSPRVCFFLDGGASPVVRAAPAGGQPRWPHGAATAGSFGKNETGWLNVLLVGKCSQSPSFPLRNTQMTRMLFLLAVPLAFIASARTARTADKPKEPLVALEKKLHGAWEADDMDCVGDLTLRADGTFERQHYSPGGKQIPGPWEVRRE